MQETNKRAISPIGRSVRDDIAERLADPDYRVEAERLAPFEQIARIVIMRRAELNLTQEVLAKRMRTTASAISRIERGQHRTSPETLRKLAKALEGQAFMGFDFGTAGKPRRDLVSL